MRNILIGKLSMVLVFMGSWSIVLGNECPSPVAIDYAEKMSITLESNLKDEKCTIKLTWSQKPEGDDEECLNLKKEAIEKLKDLNKGPVYSHGFVCLETSSEDECLASGKVYACKSAQQRAEKMGNMEDAEKWKEIKCKKEKWDSSGPFWKDMVDCEGMEEYLENVCQSGSNVKKKWACEALN